MISWDITQSFCVQLKPPISGIVLDENNLRRIATATASFVHGVANDWRSVMLKRAGCQIQNGDKEAPTAQQAASRVRPRLNCHSQVFT